MLIAIRLAAQETSLAPQQLAESLHSWLLDEPKARRHASPRIIGRPAAQGDLGLVMDVVQLAIGTGFDAAALGVSLAQWKKSKAPQFSISVEHNGRTVTVSGTDPDEVERAIQQLGED